MKTTKTALTSSIVKKHKIGVLSDTSPHVGLRLVANKNGTKSWLYRYRTPRPEYRLKQMKLGDYPAMSLAEARAEHIKQRAIRNKEGDPVKLALDLERKAQEVKLKESMASYKVSHLIQHYLDEHIASHRREKGRLECARMLQADVVDHIGDMKVVEVKRRHVHELVQRVAARAPRIATMVKVELNGAFELAISAGRVSEDFVNPTFGVKTPKHKARTRVFSDKEITRFLGWLPDSRITPSCKNMLMIMLLSGCRGGEVVSMRWKDVDLKQREWYLPKTKNGLSHRVYLSDQLIELIEAIPTNDSEYLFPSPLPKKHIRQHAIVWQLSNHRDGCGLDHWTSHDLRRTMGTGIARLGCSRVVQDRILNHVDGSVSGIYDRYSYDQEAAQWWQKWADHLDSLL